MSPRLPLTIAAVVAAMQAAALIALAVADLAGLVDGRVGVGIGIGLVLLVLGLGLLAAAFGILRGRHGARGPVVVTQLIGLGLAWSLRNPDPEIGDTRWVGVVVAASAITALAALATPAARRALADDPSAPE